MARPKQHVPPKGLYPSAGHDSATMKREAACSSENLLSVCKTVRRHNLGDHIPNYTLITVASEFGASTEVAQSQFKIMRIYAKTDKRN